MVDYSRWDSIEDEDEVRTQAVPSPAPPLSSKSPPPAYVDRTAHHQESLKLIAGWIREAEPGLKDDELTQVMKFITVQHRGIHSDNIVRYREIIGWCEAAEAEGTMPSLHTLLALGAYARAKFDDPDKEVAGKGERVMLVAMCAINTLAAIQKEGGARPLFEQLLRAPNGDVCKRYKDLAFGTDAIHDPPPDPRRHKGRPGSAPGEDAVAASMSAYLGNTWLERLGRALLIQLVVVFLASLAVFVIARIGRVFNAGAPAPSSPPLTPTTPGVAASEGEWGGAIEEEL